MYKLILRIGILISLLSMVWSPAAPAPPLLCLEPAGAEVERCRQLEEHLLAVTVRIEMQGWTTIGPYRKAITRGGKSHATVVSGRFLVTHNHFEYDLAGLAREGGEGYTGITLRTAAGELLLENAPLTAFTIVHEDPETLVLEFATASGEGLFAALGQPSAEMLPWEVVAWQVGTELAQIDWDGTRAHVTWVVVDNLDLADEVPQVQVSNFAASGASGGGVFWNGYHVGNNWARNVENDPVTDEVTRLYTLVALNSEEVGGKP